MLMLRQPLFQDFFSPLRLRISDSAKGGARVFRSATFMNGSLRIPNFQAPDGPNMQVMHREKRSMIIPPKRYGQSREERSNMEANKSSHISLGLPPPRR